MLKHGSEICDLIELHDDFGTTPKFEGLHDQKLLGRLFLQAGLLRAFKRVEDEPQRLKWPKKINPDP